MNSRLTIQDLAGLLAEYSGKDKAVSERFLRDFIAVVSESVYTDRLVKVKGLGTFKIIPVEKRESVHVNTGERFVIPEHYKFSFLPDKELRELVNKPFSFFETTELNENVDFTNMDIVSDGPEIKETEDESIEEVMPEEKQEKEVAVPKEDERPDESGPESSPPHTKRFLFVSVFVLFFVVLNIGLYLNRGHFFEQEKETLVLVDDTLSFEVKEDSLPLNEDSIRATVETAEVKPAPALPKVIARVKIEPGNRLTLISLEYYGSKLFWVYLYEHNKAVIKDPNNVPVGTVIEVPAPEIYGIDRHDRSSIEKAAARQTEILSGKL